MEIKCNGTMMKTNGNIIISNEIERKCNKVWTIRKEMHMYVNVWKVGKKFSII